ncbi:MAG TPA: hypothetical protein DD435_10265 [Cyanobacteria bacterium UBA8530]|nr:hypothetical protein [Cyanobacteria bacterium UBA8530]
MRRTIDSAEKSLSSLMEQFTRAKEGWNFDEEAYFSGKGFFLEVLAAASEQGLSIFEAYKFALQGKPLGAPISLL